MLKRENRLKTRYEYNKVRRDGVHVTSDLFHLYYLKRGVGAGKSPSPTKVGIVISNKFSKSAVKRNRVKRLIREAVRQNFDRIRPGYWIVIHPKFKTINASYEKINTDFTKILQKVPFSEEL
jgi:ribonuclease P protein component